MIRIQRHQLARFIGDDPEAIRAFESLIGEVNSLTAEPLQVSADYTISGREDFRTLYAITGASSINIDLPSGSLLIAGDQWVIAKVDDGAGNVVITPNGSDTINGAASDSLSAQYSVMVLQWTGSYWLIVSER